MANFFNLDIDKVRYDGSDIKLIKFGGAIIYEYNDGDTPLNIYKPKEFKNNEVITEVRTIVNKTHDDLSEMLFRCLSLTSVNPEDWDTSNVTNMKNMFYACTSLPTLDLSSFNTSKVTTMSEMFAFCESLTELDLSSFDTSNVTNMGYMFSGCNQLTELDLSNFDTSNVTTMSHMFAVCESLTELDLSNFDTSKVTNIYGMLFNCTSLHTLRLDNCDHDTISMIINSNGFPADNNGTIYCKGINASGLVAPGNWKFNYIDGEIPEEPEIPVDPPEEEITSYVPGEYRDKSKLTEVRTIVNYSHKDLSYMFYGCTNLTSVNTQDWNIGSVTNMDSMFGSCKSLQSLDLSIWNTSKVTDMSQMFIGCESLQSLNLSNFDTSNVTEMHSMFNGCNNLTSLDLSNFDTSNVTTMNAMFYNCYNLTTLDLSNFDTSNVTNIYGMLQGCNSLTELRLDNCRNDTIRKILSSDPIPTGLVNGKTRKIYCTMANAADLVLKEGLGWEFVYVGDGDTEPLLYKPGQFEGNRYIKKVVTIVDESHNDLSNMFNDCISLTSINTHVWDTSNVANMSGMFNNCDSLTTLDLSNFDTGNVTDMSEMFYSSNSLTSLTISDWNTGNVTNMNHMFYYCQSLARLDISNWDTSNVTDMNSMFSSCSSLTSLDLSNWDTDKVIDMNSMFSGCYKLTSLDCSNWNTSKVTDMSYMFVGCESLQSLNLSNFDTSNVTDMSRMFADCNKLHKLHLDNCSSDTINDIINSDDFPIGYYYPLEYSDYRELRIIYCKESVAKELELPFGWTFEFVLPTVPYMEYSVYDVSYGASSNKLADKYYDKNTGAEGCYGLPRVYSNRYNYSYNGYTDVEIELKDGSIAIKPESVYVSNTSKVRLWFPESTYSIKFSPAYTTSNGITAYPRLFGLTYINHSDGVTDMSYMFRDCSMLNKCEFNCNTGKVTNMSGMFYNCSILTTLDLSSFDMSETTNASSMFYGCTNLTNLNAPRNINTSFELSSSNKLTHDSLMSVINNLMTTTTSKKLTLGSTNLAKLTDEEKAIATNKGWILA